MTSLGVPAVEQAGDTVGPAMHRLLTGMLVTVAVGLSMGVVTAPARAHGPCRCLDPVLVQPGGTVRITDGLGRQRNGRGYPAYRVIFNPRPEQLGIAPGYLSSAHRVDGPSRTVLSRPHRRPTRSGRFRVPSDAPPGLYMVLILDGGEGGAHNTWDYLHVTDWNAPSTPGVVTAPTTAAPAAGAARPGASALREDDEPVWLPQAALLLVAVLVSALWSGAVRTRTPAGPGGVSPRRPSWR